MKRLIITAHPSSTSFTHAIAQTYADSASGEVEILDLYKTEHQQGFLNYENIREIPEDPARDALQAKITWADELVFVHPTWWGTVPAILKNFIDVNFSAGFAFQYVKGKSQQEKLLTGKTARVFTTCDAPGWMYFLLGRPAKKLLGFNTLSFCGIKVKSYTTFGEFRKTDDSKRAKMLEKVSKLAQK